MSTISGEIYQLKNAAGTVNRFPRTVIEAVYGLSSYLQQQFSSLADIYMPIEGISEAKTGQEFVYRKSAATIKAKSLTLDRIYGKTLAWNQLENSSGSGAESSVTLNGTTSSQAIRYINGVVTQNHKFLVSFLAKSSASVTGSISIEDGLGSWNSVTLGTNYQEIANIVTISRTSGSVGSAVKISPATASSATVTTKCFIRIDLTLMFGAGNEPTTVAEFEALYPGYHDYSAGKLISNDAAAVETVGFNVWDEEWELGSIDANGQEVSSTVQIRSKWIPCLPSTAYYVKCNTTAPGYISTFNYYDANKNFISRAETAVGNTTVTTPAGCYYIRFRCDNTTTYNHDICINISDESKNGTYEPYRLSSMPLNLNAIKVYSHNIWDEEWEVGGIDGSGNNATATDRIRSKNYTAVEPSTAYFMYSTAQGYLGEIRCYDGNKTYLGTATYRNYVSGKGWPFSTPANCRYIRFANTATYGSTYNNDICINVSGAFDGQYEPYGNGGILTIEGLKGAGSVYDEIVSNKLVKRVGRVDLGTLTWVYRETSDYQVFSANFSGSNYTDKNLTCSRYVTSYVNDIRNMLDKTIRRDYQAANGLYIKDSSFTSSQAGELKTSLNGVYVNYPLATPIEYELAEPIVPTVTAGTTEARISPNSDGLSAPMLCDMTYDANANNDSANSQYAAVAGRLMNSHQIWGQAFDGTNDVSGAMTGITTLNASGAITAGSFVKSGGTASQFLKANGTVDSTAYLPTSGGTLASTASPMLILNNTTSSTGASNYIAFKFSTTKVAEVGYWSNSAYMWNVVANKGIRIMDDGSFLYSDKTVWHSGNANATSIDWNAKALYLAGAISGATNIDSLLYFNTTNSRVGIGKSSPAQTLDVNGIINASALFVGGANGVHVGATYTGATSGAYDLIERAQENGCLYFQYNNQGPISMCYGGGYVGIGTNNPQYKLQVSGTMCATGNTDIKGALTVGTAASNQATTLNGTLAVTGNVTISNARSLRFLDTNSNSKAVIDFTDSNRVYFCYDTATAAYDTYMCGNNINLQYGTSKTTGFTLDSSGNAYIYCPLYVGTAQTNRATTLNGTLSVTSNTTLSGNLTVGASNATKVTTLYGTLSVSGNATLSSYLYLGGSTAYMNYVQANSGIHTNVGFYSDTFITAGSASSSSDERLKANIAPFDNALSILSSLKPREWDWNEKTPLEGHCAGFVAQEIQSVMPYAVEKHSEYLSLNYNVFHALEVSALQNHEERIKYLERRVAELESQLQII